MRILLFQSLSLLGAEVMGIDLLNESIEVAKEHATNVNPSRWTGIPHGAPFYRTVSVREIAQEFPQKFDAVIASEVLEHVTEWEELITDISLCLKVRNCTYFSPTLYTPFVPPFFAFYYFKSEIFLCGGYN